MGTTGVALARRARRRMWVGERGRQPRFTACAADRSTQLTSDHSVVAELERRGFITAEQAHTHPRRNEVLRSLGIEPRVEVDVDPIDVAPEDLFLLCSDGLCGVVPDARRSPRCSRSSRSTAAADALIAAAANELGGPDNVTVQIVRATRGGPGRERRATEPRRLAALLARAPA